jgi:hypothetical protein
MKYNVTIETRIEVMIEAPAGLDNDDLGDAVVEAIGPELDGIEDDLELDTVGFDDVEVEVLGTNAVGTFCHSVAAVTP